jgi:hypothetical protein
MAHIHNDGKTTGVMCFVISLIHEISQGIPEDWKDAIWKVGVSAACAVAGYIAVEGFKKIWNWCKSLFI